MVNPLWSLDDIDVTLHYDESGVEAYFLQAPCGIGSFVSSAHLIEERKIQLLRWFGSRAPLPGS